MKVHIVAKILIFRNIPEGWKMDITSYVQKILFQQYSRRMESEQTIRCGEASFHEYSRRMEDSSTSWRQSRSFLVMIQKLLEMISSLCLSLSSFFFCWNFFNLAMFLLNWLGDSYFCGRHPLLKLAKLLKVKVYTSLFLMMMKNLLFDSRRLLVKYRVW